MANQIVVSAGAKVRNLQDVIIGTSGVLSSLAFDVANGVPRLDVNGKILVSQLPNSVMEYKGTWNVSTNTPTLVNGTGNQGDVYLVEGAAVGGTAFNFGAGPITFFNGDQAIYSGTIWQRASGATGTVTSVAVTESGDSLNITGSPITTIGTINIGFNGTNLHYVNGAGNLTTFPTLTGYVPYTGATANVDLGVYDLTADLITGARGSFASNGGSDTFAINHSSGGGIALNITKGGAGEGLYINKTSGSGNAATIIGGVTLLDELHLNTDLADAYIASATNWNTAYSLRISSATLPLSITSNVISISQATTSTNGYLSSTDWNTFNGKESALTFSYPLSRVGNTISIPIATASTDGYLTDTDWFIFNSKQAALSGTGFVKISGTTISYDNSTYYLASNPSAFIALTALSAGTGISYNNTTGVITSTITQYTDALARAALSFTAGSGAYNSTTGVITIPTDNSQIANGAGYITSSALSGYLPLAGGTLTGILNINLSSGTALNVAGNAIFRGDTGVGTPRQLIITSGGSTPVYLEAKGYGANYQTDFGIKTFNSVGTAFEVFYADSSGRVGINQTSPSYQLDVNGTFRAAGTITASSTKAVKLLPAQSAAVGLPAGSAISSTGSFSIYSDSGVAGETQGLYYWNGSTYYAALQTSNVASGFSNLLLAKDGGNVGIGTGSPSGPLHLSYSSAVYDGMFFTDTRATSSSGTWRIGAGTGGVGFGIYSNSLGATPFFISNSTGAATFSSSVNIGGDLALTPTNSAITFSSGAGRFFTGGSERMRITSAGNFGFNTTNPLSIFQVKVATDYNIAFNTSGGVARISCYNDASSLNASLIINGLDVRFQADGTERMRITSGGNVWVGNDTNPYIEIANGGSTNVASGIKWMVGSGRTYYGAIDLAASSASNSYLSFSTMNSGTVAERMRITSDGNLLLGTTDNGSGAKLVFYSTTAAQQLKAAGTAPAITFSNTITSPTIGGSLGACTSAGQFLSGTAAGDMILINQFTGNKLYITNYSGGVYLTQGATSWTANSDIRLKNINSHIENAVEKLSTLQTINFSYKDDKTNKQNLGLIAQEVEKIFPELIDKNGDGMLGVRYTELVPVLIKAVQELKLEIETLKNK